MPALPNDYSGSYVNVTFEFRLAMTRLKLAMPGAGSPRQGGSEGDLARSRCHLCCILIFADYFCRSRGAQAGSPPAPASA